MFVVYLHSRLQWRSSNGSLLISITMKIKENLWTASMLFYEYIVHSHYLSRRCLFYHAPLQDAKARGINVVPTLLLLTARK